MIACQIREYSTGIRKIRALCYILICKLKSHLLSIEQVHDTQSDEEVNKGHIDPLDDQEGKTQAWVALAIDQLEKAVQSDYTEGVDHFHDGQGKDPGL